MLESQKKANRKWDEANKEKKKYIVEKSHCKRFLEKMATEEDLNFMKEIITERLN